MAIYDPGMAVSAPRLHPFWDPFSDQTGTVPAPLGWAPSGRFLGATWPVLPCQGPGVASLALSAWVALILSCPRGYPFGGGRRGQAP